MKRAQKNLGLWGRYKGTGQSLYPAFDHKDSTKHSKIQHFGKNNFTTLV